VNVARAAYRWLTLLLVVDVLLQLFLAGSGVFRSGAGKAARDSSAFDPHRVNGYVVLLLALLTLVAAAAARNGRWRFVLPFFVLALIQPVLAIKGWAGGLHALAGALILVGAAFIAHGAWANARRASRV
jgi:hypothetical protein